MKKKILGTKREIITVRYINPPPGVPHPNQRQLGSLRISPSYMDSFEAQTDRMSSTDAHAELLKRVRAAREETADSVALTVLWEIEDMLGTAGFWKLELKQRRRGKRQIPLAVVEAITHIYDGEMADPDRNRSAKSIIGELAKEYGVPDTTIRGIIRRATGKKPRR